MKIEPGSLTEKLNQATEEWSRSNKVRRLWNKDATLWTDKGEEKWLGWLDIVDEQLADVDRIERAGRSIRDAGCETVLLLGMGGSSLAPEVFAKTFGSKPGYPTLRVLDSTVPEQIESVASQCDPASTLVLVASKSGSTIEPNMLKKFIADRTARALGDDKVGSAFFTVTDPGTAMNRIAEQEKFRFIFFGRPTIGGRFSVFSDFGIIPFAATGNDAVELLRRAKKMRDASSATVQTEANPAVQTGLLIGVAAKEGRDKLTLFTSPGVASIGGWLEQLIAESTGKEGKGIVPIDGEPILDSNAYGDDRCYVRLALANEIDDEVERLLDEQVERGAPVIRIELTDRYDVAGEMLRFELATAVAGAVLGINPFDQPDVESAKVEARGLIESYAATKRLPVVDEAIGSQADDAQAFAGPNYRTKLESIGVSMSTSFVDVVVRHLESLRAGDYFAINAYLAMKPEYDAAFGAIRRTVAERKRVPTTLGYGPRFLHSTGQLHKGGPNNGVFIQITADDSRELPIPGDTITFNALKAAQASGDFKVLDDRGRRILRVHLSANVERGIKTLADAIGRI